MAAVHQFVEFVLQGAGYGSGLAVADGAEINFAQRDHFGGRAADKNFVGDIELVARDRLLDNGIT